MDCCVVLRGWDYKVEESWVLTKTSYNHGRGVLKGKKFKNNIEVTYRVPYPQR